jgi:hypothetical protein
MKLKSIFSFLGKTMLIALAVVLVTEVVGISQLSISYFPNIVKSDQPYMTGTDSLKHTVTFTVDSLGYDAIRPFGVWTPEYDVLVSKMTLSSSDTISNGIAESCQVFIRSGSTITAKTIYFFEVGTTNMYSNTYTTDFTIAAGTACTTFVNDGGIDVTGDGSHNNVATLQLEVVQK